MAAATKKAWRALTHLSVHRDRHQYDAPGQTGADFYERGDKVELDEERSKRLQDLGAIEPWDSDEPDKFPTARDMSGKSFPDQQNKTVGEGTAADPSNQPEATDVQPPVEKGKAAGGAPDPYAK